MDLRDQLRSAAQFCGTLLHEAVHAESGCDDATIDFEVALTTCLGALASGRVNGRGVGAPAEE